MTNFEKCRWCKVNPGCEKNDFWKECEFRSLKFEKQDILERVRSEWEKIRLMREKVVAGAALEEVSEMFDKMHAVQIMMGVLEEEFGMKKKEVLDVLKVEKPSLIESVKLMAKIKMLQKSRGGKK
jgi:hypothetical protein